jgi:LPXTG-site transpeptidase (sortase) family protein
LTTDQDVEQPEVPEESAQRRGRGKVAATVSILGELLITAGVVLALFVVYSLWWTNVLANHEARQEGDKVRDQWAQQDGSPDEPAPRTYDDKDGIGFLHIPAMGKGYEVLVVKGTDPEELNKGVAGYYTKPRKAAMPWDDKDGNFSIAAHRDGHGAKFHKLDKVKNGDVVAFETKDEWYIYKVFKTLPETSKYNVGVIESVPKGSGKKDPGKYITLTTCTPVYTSRYRLIVWGELVRTEKVDERRTLPAELS